MPSSIHNWALRSAPRGVAPIRSSRQKRFMKAEASGTPIRNPRKGSLNPNGPAEPVPHVVQDSGFSVLRQRYSGDRGVVAHLSLRSDDGPEQDSDSGGCGHRERPQDHHTRRSFDDTGTTRTRRCGSEQPEADERGHRNRGDGN